VLAVTVRMRFYFLGEKVAEIRMREGMVNGTLTGGKNRHLAPLPRGE